MAIRFACPHCGAIAHVADIDAGKVASCSRCGSLTTVPRYSSGATAPITEHSRDVLYIGDQSMSRWAKGLLIWLAVLVCIALVAALLVPALQPARKHTGHDRCGNNLRQIALALINYDAQYGCLPPAYTTDENGRPMHSWRALLIPFLAEPELYYQYDLEQPWDSPTNLVALRQMPEVFRCSASDEEEGYTNFVVIIGDPEQFPQTLFTPDRPLSLDEVGDGISNTIMVVEAVRAVPWTMPGADLHFNRMTMRFDGGPASISLIDHQSVAFADGSLRWIDGQHLDAETLRLLIQPNDGAPTIDWSSVY